MKALDELISKIFFQVDDKGLKQGRDELGRFTSKVKESGATLAGMKRAVADVNTVLAAIRSPPGLKQGRDELGQLTAKAKGAKGALGSLRKAMLEAFAFHGIVNILRDAATGIVDVNRRFQTLHSQLVTIEGSASKANAAFSLIREFAVKTPFEVEETTDAYTKLKSQGIEPTMRALTSFGDTAAASGKSFTQYTEAVLDAAMGQYERLNEFGIKMGAEGDKVWLRFKGVTQYIKKDQQAIAQALIELGEKHFGGAMARISKTLDGAFSNLKDSAAALALAIGEGGLNAAILDVARSMSGAAGDSRSLGAALGQFLGVAVRETYGLFQTLGREIRSMDVGTVRQRLKAISELLWLIGKAVSFALSHWDKFMYAFAGVKTAQGFAAVTTGLKGLEGRLAGFGAAAAAALGPWGKIVAAVIMAIPYLKDAAEYFADIAYQKSQLGIEHRQMEVEAGGRRTTRQQGPTEGFATPELGAAIMAKHQEIADLNKIIDTPVEGDPLGQKTVRAKWRQEKARKRIIEAREELTQLLIGNRGAYATIQNSARLWAETMEGVQAGLTERGVTGATEANERSKVAQYQQMLRQGKRLKPSERKELRNLAVKYDIDIDVQKGREVKTGLWGQDVSGQTSALAGIESAIEEAADRAAKRAFVMGFGGATQREAAARAAYDAERARLRGEVERGNLRALGGEWSIEQQMLREAGVIPEGTIAPPVLTITINRVDAKVEAPITVNVAAANATAVEIADAARGAVVRVLNEQIKTAAINFVPKQKV